jgi:hypothetical protein
MDPALRRQDARARKVVARPSQGLEIDESQPKAVNLLRCTPDAWIGVRAHVAVATDHSAEIALPIVG